MHGICFGSRGKSRGGGAVPTVPGDPSFTFCRVIPPISCTVYSAHGVLHHLDHPLILLPYGGTEWNSVAFVCTVRSTLLRTVLHIEELKTVEITPYSRKGCTVHAVCRECCDIFVMLNTQYETVVMCFTNGCNIASSRIISPVLFFAVVKVGSKGWLGVAFNQKPRFLRFVLILHSYS